MMERYYAYGLIVWLTACTDVGVIGERTRSSAGTGGSPKLSAAGSSGSAPCPFGVCELPPFCTSPEPYCILCENDADCVRDPVDRFCSPLYGTCVACLTNADCDPDTPYCEGGECGVCAEDNHCPEDQKCNDGQCEQD